MSKSGNLVFKSSMNMNKTDANDKPTNKAFYGDINFYENSNGRFNSFDDSVWYKNMDYDNDLSQYNLKAYIKSKIAELKKLEAGKTYRFDLTCSIGGNDSTGSGYGYCTSGAVDGHLGKLGFERYSLSMFGTTNIQDGYQNALVEIAAIEHGTTGSGSGLRIFDTIEYRYTIKGPIDEATGETLAEHNEYVVLRFRYYYDTDSVLVSSNAYYNGNTDTDEVYFNVAVYEV